MTPLLPGAGPGDAGNGTGAAGAGGHASDVHDRQEFGELGGGDDASADEVGRGAAVVEVPPSVGGLVRVAGSHSDRIVTVALSAWASIRALVWPLPVSGVVMVLMTSNVPGWA